MSDIKQVFHLSPSRNSAEKIFNSLLQLSIAFGGMLCDEASATLDEKKLTSMPVSSEVQRVIQFDVPCADPRNSEGAPEATSDKLCNSAEYPNEPSLQKRRKSPVLDSILSRRLEIRQQKRIQYKRLATIGITSDQIAAAIQRTKMSGATIVQELAAYNELDIEKYYYQLAQDLDLEFASTINPATILSDMSPPQKSSEELLQVFGRSANGFTILYVAPDINSEQAILALILRDPKQKQRIRICSPKTISDAVEVKFEQNNLLEATNRLNQMHPILSAKQVFAPWQAYVLGLLCAAFPIALYQNFSITSHLIQISSMALFFMVVLLRIFALRKLKARHPFVDHNEIQSYPTYSVLIALHKEEAVVEQLVTAMSRLDWPQSRLEVLYVCEADDHGTINALHKYGLPPRHRIIYVPPSLPRTKPKALNYALNASKGDFIVIYDAEDRPHHQQLKEAWSKFSANDESLVCLQAPLYISNANNSWLSRMFAFEYASHFKGLLPYLAESGVPLPLGGTSNHFRRSALETVGGWDPYNVTEDADLGIRFYRFGFKCGTIESPTLEDGPETIREWLPQRTRWQKGWMQTFLVQNRNVLQLAKALDTRSLLHFEALLAGFILSPLLYCASLILALYSLYSLQSWQFTATMMGLLLLIMGYFCSAALGLECTKHWSLKHKMIVALTLPIYWLLISVAAWRAAFQLIRKPHHWEKTPHRPTCTGNTSADENNQLSDASQHIRAKKKITFADIAACAYG